MHQLKARGDTGQRVRFYAALDMIGATRALRGRALPRFPLGRGRLVPFGITIPIAGPQKSISAKQPIGFEFSAPRSARVKATRRAGGQPHQDDPRTDHHAARMNTDPLAGSFLSEFLARPRWVYGRFMSAAGRCGLS